VSVAVTISINSTARIIPVSRTGKIGIYRVLEIERSRKNEVEKYISNFDKEVQLKLNAIREAIIEIAPEATGRICMGVPTYDLNGKWLVHFAAFKKHIGFYSDPDGILAFKNKLKEYKTSKGTA